MKSHKELVSIAKRTIDRLGRHMDSGIIETVVSLWKRDIQTLASCEGHYDHGCPYPWVDIAPSSVEPIEALLARFYQQYSPKTGRLMLDKYSCSARLMPDIEQQNYTLEQAQTEMLKFAIFCDLLE